MGSRVGTDGVHPDNMKLTVIINWQQPPDLLNLGSFLGLSGYFHNLIKGYAKIVQPLTDLICNTSILKGAGKAAYWAALRKVKLPNIWNGTHQSTANCIHLKKNLSV